MLSKLIVDSYAWLLEVGLWVALVAAAVVGYHGALPVAGSIGVIAESPIAWQLLGAVTTMTFTFLALAVVVGPILTLVDIRQAVRRIEASTEASRDSQSPLPTERTDPAI